ncbi:DUF5131 family protein [Amycolatopsis nigrescens]|uniref:DUF5131 family protein n=1 Tax=Amycolatopsis nigrescens TaxID=381445 RepID=UPI0003678046|nr:phage Gp37/Gp68 family protein [Amycolatopsis nigrescens]
MSATTSIEWTRGEDGSPGSTWNPVTGCTEVSPGCDRCYAKTFAERWRGTPDHYFERGFDVQLRPDKLDLPLRWRKPRKVFVNSMSDLFHKDVPDDFIARVFRVMALAPQHSFQTLTKRPARMRSLLTDYGFVRAMLRHDTRSGFGVTEDKLDQAARRWVASDRWPLPNVWLGTSVETQRWADIRVPVLLDTPAAIRFLSCEPLLGPVDLSRWLELEYYDSFGWGREMLATLAGRVGTERGLHWVIAGGESGRDRGVRPMHPGWVRSLRDQCEAAAVPFLFKQWGEWAPAGLGIGMAQHNVGREVLVGPPVDEMGHRQVMRRVGKGRAGRELDGRTWDQYPPAAVPAGRSISDRKEFG